MPIKALMAILRNGLQHFRADQAGNVAVIFTLALVPIVGFVGSGVDYSRGNSAKTAMQMAADATVLALAKYAASLSSTQLTEQANSTFKALLTRPEAENVQVAATYSTRGNLL